MYFSELEKKCAIHFVDVMIKHATFDNANIELRLHSAYESMRIPPCKFLIYSNTCCNSYCI